mgnify:CR=1 FL=1
MRRSSGPTTAAVETLARMSSRGDLPTALAACYGISADPTLFTHLMAEMGDTCGGNVAGYVKALDREGFPLVASFPVAGGDGSVLVFAREADAGLAVLSTDADGHTQLLCSFRREPRTSVHSRALARLALRTLFDDADALAAKVVIDATHGLRLKLHLLDLLSSPIPQWWSLGSRGVSKPDLLLERDLITMADHRCDPFAFGTLSEIGADRAVALPPNLRSLFDADRRRQVADAHAIHNRGPGGGRLPPV